MLIGTRRGKKPSLKKQERVKRIHKTIRRYETGQSEEKGGELFSLKEHNNPEEKIGHKVNNSTAEQNEARKERQRDNTELDEGAKESGLKKLKKEPTLQKAT